MSYQSSDSAKPSGRSRKHPHYWLIYSSALLAGLLLLADALQYSAATRLPAKFGIGLVYAALAFMIGGNRPSAIIGTIILWTAIVLTFVF
jgi:hypothetical protein